MTTYMPGYKLHALARRVGQFDQSPALQELLDSLAYIPPAEKPKMKALRGNPLTPLGWSVVAGVVIALCMVTLWVA